MTIEQVINEIKPANQNAMQMCERRFDSIAKPLKSLGKLEYAIIKIAGMIEKHEVEIDKKALVIMCADNGVVEEKITQTGQEVTAIVAENFLENKATVSIMAGYTNTKLFPIDIGIAKDTKLMNKKIAYSTKNFAKEPAMTKEEASQAILTGISTVFELKKEGYQIIATGEMGIGNTTTSSAIASVLLDKSVDEVTGRGAGLSNEGLIRKIKVINDAILLHQPNKEDMIDILSKIGGFDIGGLIGVFLGGARYRIPVVIDGFISAVAALMAVKMNPLVKDYLLPSHVSKEPAAQMILDEIGLSPFITCDMCLGEGTGAVTLFPILDMAVRVYQEMSTFEQIKVDAYQPLDA